MKDQHVARRKKKEERRKKKEERRKKEEERRKKKEERGKRKEIIRRCCPNSQVFPLAA
ncbi:MAG TPA: hypothetical protein PLI38_07530 [Flavobacterium sp.]|nr:hypothetical protein [Flavobacterium sp.]